MENKQQIPTFKANEYYDSNCKKCKKDQQHYSYIIIRKKGVKLRCAVCGNIKDNYVKFQYLKVSQ